MAKAKELSVIGVEINVARQKHDLTLYRVAKNAGMDYSILYRVMRQSTSTRETLKRISDAIGCTPEERSKIFHAAGYLTPEEVDEEYPSRKKVAA